MIRLEVNGFINTEYQVIKLVYFPSIFPHIRIRFNRTLF
jgi:hypothetical protein